MQHLPRSTRAFAVALPLAFAPDLFAGGACCVVQVGGGDKPRLGLATVHAQSHETVAGAERQFSQQGLVMRLSWPLVHGLGIAGTAGWPVHTDLEGIGSGWGGWIAGAGLSWSLPLGDLWTFGTSVSVSRASGKLGGDDAWNLSELQGMLLVDRTLSWTSSLYAGVRASGGDTELERDGKREAVHSDFHPTGFGGWKKGWTESFATVLEAGYGHGWLVSLGASVPLR